MANRSVFKQLFSRPDKDGDGDDDPRARPVFGMALRVTTLLPVVAVVAYAGAGRFPKAEFFSVFGIALLTSAAAAILGALVGFLFGLPRTAADRPQTGPLSTNTNLDQVSDWLTKILVGLGLVQIGKLASGIDSLAETLAPGLGGAADAKTFALGLLVYSLIAGFLIGYLATRIVITIRLKEVEDLLAVKEDVLKTPPPEKFPPPVQPPPSGAAPPSAAGGAELAQGAA